LTDGFICNICTDLVQQVYGRVQMQSCKVQAGHARLREQVYESVKKHFALRHEELHVTQI
jgi:hypothetical protein